jgi:hypothetical protein
LSRSKLRPRLENLTTSVNLSQRDREFAESLLVHYNRKGGLTAGRRVWVDKLEARAKENKNSPPETNVPLMARIKRIIEIAEKSSWDKGFAESVKEQLQLRGSLSPRQIEIFEQIEERHSVDALDARATWSETYLNEGLKERAEICAHYYLANPPYFSGLARRVIQPAEGEEVSIPSQSEYKKMCENKYALRVIEESLGEPAFNVGQLVQFRARHRISGKVASVLQIMPEPVTSAAKGAKKYLVISFGGIKPFTVEERDIKKYRG